MFILKVAFITTHKDADVGHVLKLRHCDVAMTSTQRKRYVTSYTTNANGIHVKIFFLGCDNMGETRISIPSENLGFPYPVCKKRISIRSEKLRMQEKEVNYFVAHLKHKMNSIIFVYNFDSHNSLFVLWIFFSGKYISTR